MTHKIEDWIFHEDYFDNTMPKSIQAMVKKQLNNSKTMPIDDITEIHPVIENRIARASVNYQNKKIKSRDYHTLKSISQTNAVVSNKRGAPLSKKNDVKEEPKENLYDELNDLLKDISL